MIKKEHFRNLFLFEFNRGTKVGTGMSFLGKVLSPKGKLEDGFHVSRREILT